MPNPQSTSNPTASDQTEATEPTAAEPALSASARALLEQLVKQMRMGAGHVVANADAQEATAVFNLLGSGQTNGFDAHLAMPCEAERPASAPTCGLDFPNAMPFVGQFNTCFTQGCLGPKQSYIDVYITTDPSKLPDARAPISFHTTGSLPAGTVTYDPNPLTRWITDATDSAAVRVKAELAENVHVEIDGEEPLDFSYEGSAEGVQSNGTYTLSIDLKLPSLLASQAVSVSIEQNEDMSVTGKISAGEKMLAEVSSAAVSWAQ